jgi:CRISPR-associated protein Csy2
LDALLDALKITYYCEVDDDGKLSWIQSRQQKGWLIPISTGFQGISELNKAELQRDPETPHRFAESVVTLAEFIMPYRLDSLEQMLWHYQTDQENTLYLCQQS